MSDTNNEILLQEEKQDSKEYRRSLWIVEHREKIGNIGIVILAIFDICLVLFVVWSLVDAFVLSAGNEQRSVIESVSLNQEDLHAYTEAQAADSMIVSDASTFPSANNKYDFYTQIENPNEDWWAEFEYQFVFEGGSTGIKQGFILPQSKKPIVELAFVNDAGLQNAQFQFESISWHRIDHHLVPDYVTWSQDRLDLEIQNPTIMQDPTIDKNGLFRTTFTVHNNTAFNYYNPTFYLLLKRGATVVGVNKTQLQTLVAGETQEVVVNWFGTTLSASQVDVVPDLNLFDTRLYKSLEGSETIDTRTFAP